MPTNMPPSRDDIYTFDPGSPVELARLTEESWLFTKAMGGPLADLPDPSAFHRVLSVACGPGDWALDVAFAYPHMDVAGVDFSSTVIQYAIAKAQSQRLSNVSFGTMNWLEPLDFSDNTFDLISGRFLCGLIPRGRWPAVLSEFLRVLRPGGMLYLTDSDRILTNSSAYEKINTLIMHALCHAGYGLAPAGCATESICSVLSDLFRTAGLQQVTCTTHSIDFSAGTDAWMSIYRQFEIIGQSTISLVTRSGNISQEEMETLYRQALIEMMAEDFYGLWPFLCMWGVKL